MTLFNVTVNVCDHHQTCSVLGCGVSNGTLCNCDDACVRYGDCCWDFASTCNHRYDTHENDWDFGAFRSLTTCETVPSNSLRRPWQSYLMVGRCPVDWPFVEIRDLCERYSMNDSVIQWLRVDNQQGVTFKNIYCAFCNGMEPQDVISWKIFANCSNNMTISSIWRNLLECSDVHMKPSNHRTPTNLRPCSCCLPNESLHQTFPSCGLSQASAPVSKACAMYKAPIIVEQRRYNNPHCFQCDISFKNLNSTVYGSIPSQDVCPVREAKMAISDMIYTPALDFIVPVSIFFDLPTLDELFKTTRKGTTKASVKSCENGNQPVFEV